MTFGIRKAVSALAIMAIAAGALLGGGCGADGSERAVAWNVDPPGR